MDNAWMAMSVLPLVFFVLWLSVVIYLIVMLTRLVRGVERIATAVERNRSANG